MSLILDGIAHSVDGVTTRWWRSGWRRERV